MTQRIGSFVCICGERVAFYFDHREYEITLSNTISVYHGSSYQSKISFGTHAITNAPNREIMVGKLLTLRLANALQDQHIKCANYWGRCSDVLRELEKS